MVAPHRVLVPWPPQTEAYRNDAKEQRMDMMDMAKGTATGKDVLEAGLLEVSKLQPALLSCGFKLGRIEIGVAASPSIMVTIERTHGDALSLASMLERQDLTSTQRSLVTSVHKAYAMTEMIRRTGHEVEAVRISLGVHPAVTIVLAPPAPPTQPDDQAPSMNTVPTPTPARPNEVEAPKPAERTLASPGRPTVIGPGMISAQTPPRPPSVRPGVVPPPERIVTADPEATLIQLAQDVEAAAIEEISLEEEEPTQPDPPEQNDQVPLAQGLEQTLQAHRVEQPPQAQPQPLGSSQAQQHAPAGEPQQVHTPAPAQVRVPPPPPQVPRPSQPPAHVPPPPQFHQPQAQVPPPAQPQPPQDLSQSRSPVEATQIDRELAPAQPAPLPPTQMESAPPPVAAAGYAVPPPGPHAGSWVLVTWSDGNRYRGQIVQLATGQCLIQFEDGACHWIPNTHLSPA